MDIDLLSKMVKELILDNDRVVLPGLGCFVAEMVPSTFSDKGYTINPPYRRLYFRSRPDQGDALTRLYAEGNGVEMEIADKIITDFVAELKGVLFSFISLRASPFLHLPGFSRIFVLDVFMSAILAENIRNSFARIAVFLPFPTFFRGF